MAGKKKKKSKAAPNDSKMFDSKTLRCLVCRNLINEFEAAIWKIDPKKVIDTGTYRVNEKGVRDKKIVREFNFVSGFFGPFEQILFRFNMLDPKRIF